MNSSIVVAVFGIFLLLVFAKWWWKRRARCAHASTPAFAANCLTNYPSSKQATPERIPSGNTTHVIHRLCPHNNVVQGFEVEKKDSLDEHLDLLTRKLADKVGDDDVHDEGRLRLSKYKIREKQHEIDNLHAIDNDLKSKYRDIIENLRKDLSTNEQECRKLQDQIEWVSRRRAELKEDVQQGHRMYGDIAAGLVNNISDIHERSRVTDKPLHCSRCLRHRKEPVLPHVTPVGSVVIKSSPKDSPASMSYVMQN